MNDCTDCGAPCPNKLCRKCRLRKWHAADRAKRRAKRQAELDGRPIPVYQPPVRTPAEEAEAAARVAELREAAGDLNRLSAAATESLRRHLDRRGTSPL